MAYTLDEWFAGGERVPVRLASGEFRVFRRVMGTPGTPWMTLLHGFPTCSWDWAQVADPLAARFRLLLPDFLGYGDSDKPAEHEYTIGEQADLIEQLWRREGVGETWLVAHDFGDTVAAELLARQAEGRGVARIRGAVLLNGGIYVDAYHPLPIQTWLRRPFVGPFLSARITERTFAHSFAGIFSPRYPIAPADLHQHWLAVSRHDGQRIAHRLIRYIDERMRTRSRWEGALERLDPPKRFLWGLMDPVSGQPVAARLRQRSPEADIFELSVVGHYPQLEVPEEVVEQIVSFCE